MSARSVAVLGTFYILTGMRLRIKTIATNVAGGGGTPRLIFIDTTQGSKAILRGRYKPLHVP